MKLRKEEKMRRIAATVATILFGLGILCGKAHADPLMFTPFKYGEMWYCTQGQGGNYSHQGNQYYGFDFNKGSNVNNTSNPAYGKNLYSPVDGEIVEIRRYVHDFQNNSSSNSTNNWGWGNTIVIEDTDGNYYVRLAHMRYGTTWHLDVGDQVEMGDYLGQVGQTGYSTSPHLHIQVMTSSMGVSEPFTFAEGKLYTGEWIKSGLLRNASILDNNNERTLSNYFDYAHRYYTTYKWQKRTGVDDYAGKDYLRHYVASTNDQTKFSWRFRVAQSGYYYMSVTFPHRPEHDPQAEYSFDEVVMRIKNQQTSSARYKYLGYKYLAAGVYHTVSVRGKTPGKYVVADGLLVRKF